MAAILSRAGIIESTANNNKAISKKLCFSNFKFEIENLFRNFDLEIGNSVKNHLKKIITTSMRQMLKLSKLFVTGIAKNKGIDRMKKIKISFRFANKK
jgi:hypothetical protein